MRKNIPLSVVVDSVLRILREEGYQSATVEFHVGEIEIRGEADNFSIKRIAKYLEADDLFRLTERGTIRF